MAEERTLSDRTLRVQGSDKVEVPAEVRAFYEGKGISFEFLKAHYGLGQKGVSVKPTPSDLKGQMLGPG